MTPSYLIEVKNVVQAAQNRPGWSVMLVPKSRYEESLRTLSALTGQTIRTVLWGETGHKFSLAYAGEEVFIPKGTPFDLFLAGWSTSTKEDSKTLMTWRDAAKDLIPCSDWVV